MNNSRRNFLEKFTISSLAILSGSQTSIKANDFFDFQKKPKLRFVVASDGHFGQPKTDFNGLFDNAISQINKAHLAKPFDFAVINGDIIHDKKEYLREAKAKLDLLKMPYYVTKGNHDMVSDEYWQSVWQMPVNHHVKLKNSSILLATTSNEKGQYLSPDLDWLKTALDDSQRQKHCFIFIHIPQAKWTANAIETPAFFELLKSYKNIKAVFHGHEHDQDGIIMQNGLPFIFDSHIGGNWGTKYNGFRVVELMKDNTLITYMMNPTEKIKEELI